MRTWIIALLLMLFLFIVPLQFFIIGNDAGFGLQGAVYRYQITIYGTSLITIPYELTYVTGGIYAGKTALMVIFWAAGTLVLTLTTLAALLCGNQLPRKYLRPVLAGLIAAGVLYLASCIAQYGFLFHGPSGLSLPFGVIVLFMFALFLYCYPDLFFDEGPGETPGSVAEEPA